MNRSERRKRKQICRNLAGSGVSATRSPLIYEEERRHQLLRLVVNSYRTSQNYEYNISPPHWKTTEALTNRRQGKELPGH